MTENTVPRLGVSERSAVSPFFVMDIVARAAKMAAEGRHVISLCVGEPSQGAPTDVRERAAKVFTDGTNLGYSPVNGIPALRQAIAGHYKRWYGLELDPDRVFVTTGSSGAFTLGFLAVFDVGQRVALARPGYAAYKNILAGLGLEVVELDCGPAERYQPTVAQLAAEHAKSPLSGLVIASPANPTGTMLDRAQLTEISDWCTANGVRLVSDEIYQGLTFAADLSAPDALGVTAAEINPDAIVISSFSKFWGMTGWRLGWAIVPENVASAMSGLAGNFTLCPPVPSQVAAVEAFTERSYQEGFEALNGFAKARQMVLDAIPELGWYDVAPADGAFYMYAKVDNILGPYANATEYCSALMDQQAVALSPGTDFDTIEGNSAVRLSLAAGPEAVAEALERIKAFQRGYQAG
jgi:aspartate/methionine/tyrosine aminotransferase